MEIQGLYPYIAEEPIMSLGEGLTPPIRFRANSFLKKYQISDALEFLSDSLIILKNGLSSHDRHANSSISQTFQIVGYNPNDFRKSSQLK